MNDNTTASRQFEAWVAVDNHGRVHVAWTDYRDGGQNENTGTPALPIRPKVSKRTPGDGWGTAAARRTSSANYKGITSAGA